MFSPSFCASGHYREKSTLLSFFFCLPFSISTTTSFKKTVLEPVLLSLIDMEPVL